MSSLKHYLRHGRKTILPLLLFVSLALVVAMALLYANARFNQMEATASLGELTAAQVSLHADTTRWSDNFNNITWSPPSGDVKYTYFLSPKEYRGKDPKEFGLSLPVNFDAFGVPTPGPTRNGFIAVAIGDLDCDSELDIWWIDQDNKPMNAQDDVEYWPILIDCFSSSAQQRIARLSEE